LKKPRALTAVPHTPCRTLVSHLVVARCTVSWVAQYADARDWEGGTRRIPNCFIFLWLGDVVSPHRTGHLLGISYSTGHDFSERLGEILQLSADDRVLDAACGKGTTAIFLAERFGCEVTGIDYSETNVCEASKQAEERGLASRVHFRRGDAEKLPIADATITALICECSFCTFPSKEDAAREFARVLVPGGKVGISDLTRTGELPSELDGMLSWTACIGDAPPAENYCSYLKAAGMRADCIEHHNEGLLQMVEEIRKKLFGAEILVGLQKLSLPSADFASAKRIAKAAMTAIRDGMLGYTLIVATKVSRMETAA
jgi:arsenite methyltransferase